MSWTTVEINPHKEYLVKTNEGFAYAIAEDDGSWSLHNWTGRAYGYSNDSVLAYGVSLDAVCNATESIIKSIKEAKV